MPSRKRRAVRSGTKAPTPERGKRFVGEMEIMHRPEKGARPGVPMTDKPSWALLADQSGQLAEGRTIVAVQGSTRFLVTGDTDLEVFMVDTEQSIRTSMPLQSVLARGYWEEPGDELPSVEDLFLTTRETEKLSAPADGREGGASGADTPAREGVAVREDAGVQRAKNEDLDEDFVRLTALVAKRIARDHQSDLGEMAHLQPAVRAALPAAFPGSGLGSCRVALTGWGDRLPGPVDFALKLSNGATVYGECKVDKLDETLWDLMKLCSIPGARRSYMVVAAWGDYWQTKPVAPLYTMGTGPRDHAFADLIHCWRKAWDDLLIGGRGIRPTTVPAKARIEVLACHQVAAYPAWELRCISVSPVGDETLTFGDNGLPQAS